MTVILNSKRLGLVFVCASFLSLSSFAGLQTKSGAAPSTTGAKAGNQAPKTQSQGAAVTKEPAKVEDQSAFAVPGALFPAVVARVNGTAILGQDLEQRIQNELAPIGNPKWESLREDYRGDLTSRSLGALIANELLLQKASASGMKATSAEVKSEFDRVAKTFANDAAFNTALVGRGTDRAGLMRELERSLTLSRFIQENVGKKIAVTPEEVSQYYATHKEDFRHEDLVRTSHILILVPEGAAQELDRALKTRAEALLVRAKKNEDFARLAKENSMDASASDGGDIGYVSKGQLAVEYEEAAFALPAGAISDLVRTRVGYHIIKVTDKKRAGVSTLEEVKEQLTTFLKDQKVDSEAQKIVGELRGKAKVEILIPVPAPAPPAKADAPSKP
jgi:parvulin-like peptidyl-prolyl isomerase